jgi:glycosyltransferase involved in cell wall biosynthesis
MSKKKKILFVAFPDSIHTARWIGQLCKTDYEIHLVSSNESMSYNSELQNVIYHKFKTGIGKTFIKLNKSNIFHSVYNFFNKFLTYFFSAYSIFRQHFVLFLENRKPGSTLLKFLKQSEVKKIQWLTRKIKKIKPDVIHSLETQSAGYLVSGSKRIFGEGFPYWIHSNWGADIHLFGRQAKHRSRIEEVLKTCDLYLCECLRDLALARQFGYPGRFIEPYPNTGGLDPNKTAALRSQGKTSERKIISLKGYQGWAGRALTGIRALERCADILKGHEIAIYLGFALPEVVLAGELLEEKTGIPVHILPMMTHEDMLKLHGKSRISIGLSITDAISTSLLEAMAMGSFPIQSNTSCADEWIKDGETGLLVPPEDPEEIEKAIRKAITDNNLVDSASEINIDTIRKRADYFKLREMTIDIYKEVMR